MFEFLRRRLRAKSDPDPATQGGWEMLGNLTGWKNANSVWEQLNNADREALMANAATVYSCVRRLYSAAPEAPLRFGRQIPAGWEDSPDHPAAWIGVAPCPDMSYPEWLQRVVQSLQLTGTAYIWKWRSRAGSVNELWPIPTSWIQNRLVDAAGQIVGYKIWQGSGKPPRDVLREDIVRVLFPDPRNLTEGLAPLQAAMREIQMDTERQDHQVEALINCLPVGTTLFQPESWSEEQKAAARRTFRALFTRNRRRDPLFMTGEGAKVEQHAPLAGFDWKTFSTLTETRICAAFGVSPILLGLSAGTEAATYANYEVAEKSFYRTTMSSLWTLLDAAFTRGLLRAEGDDQWECYHDTGEVRGLKEDAAEAADRAARLFTGGLCMRDEAREIAGLDRLGDERGKAMVLPMTLVEIGGEGETPPRDTGRETAET